MPAHDATERLYLEDPLLTSFSARVLGHSRWGDWETVILDRSAFYPEAGGQQPDHGMIDGAPVLDVQVDSDGVVHHFLDAPPPLVDAEVGCEIDASRRREFMALHTGQHMLSRALLDVAGARTLSSRLGERVCTLDVHLPKLSEKQLDDAEQLVNSHIDEDLEVRAYYPAPEELARLELRRSPKVETNVRVVDIGGFDLVPCGGTHCVRTSQVGLITIVSAERYKKKTRLTFTAGTRARAMLVAHYRVLARLGLDFTCAPRDVPKAVGNLRQELEAAKEALRTARGSMAEAKADSLVNAAESPFVVAMLSDVDVKLLRATGTRIVEGSERVALLASLDAKGTRVFTARGEESSFDCGKFLGSVTAATGGRGGGRPDHAEGLLPADVDWVPLVKQLLSRG